MFSIMSLNLANSSMDEEGPNPLGLRLRNIYKRLICVKPDIMMFTELRVCKDYDDDILHPTEIARRLLSPSYVTKGSSNDYDDEDLYQIAILAPNDLNKQSFWKMIAYNPNYVYHKESEAIPIDVASLKKPLNMLVSCFEKMGFIYWVINIHFPMENQVEIAQWLVDNVESIITKMGGDLKEGRVIFQGDLNVFLDKDGVKQLEILRTKFTIPENSVSTFRSFPHNPWQGESILDYVGLMKNTTDTVTIKVHEIDHNISDHAIFESFIKRY